MAEKKKMRICFLGHKRMPSKEGGIEVVVGELYPRMAAMGYDVTGYNRRGHHVSGVEFDTNDELKEYKGVHLKSVPTIDKKGLAAMSASFFAAVATVFGKYDTRSVLLPFFLSSSTQLRKVSVLLDIKNVTMMQIVETTEVILQISKGGNQS